MSSERNVTNEIKVEHVRVTDNGRRHVCKDENKVFNASSASQNPEEVERSSPSPPSIVELPRCSDVRRKVRRILDLVNDCGEAQKQLAQSTLPFVPGFLLSYLVDLKRETSSTNQNLYEAKHNWRSRSQRFARTTNGIVLLADVTGYSKIANLLSEGNHGIQKVMSSLNELFSQLVDRILDAGGDVISFAGDAIIALWAVPGADCRSYAQAAVHCAMQASAICIPLQIPEKNVDFSLTLHTGVATGRVCLLSVGGGGQRDEYELMMIGDPLKAAGVAQGRAFSKGVVGCGETMALVSDCCEYEYAFHKPKRGPAVAPAAGAAGAWTSWEKHPLDTLNDTRLSYWHVRSCALEGVRFAPEPRGCALDLLDQRTASQILHVVRSYAPSAALRAQSIGRIQEQFRRQVSTVFAQLGNFGFDAVKEDGNMDETLGALDTMFKSCQACVDRYEGMIRQFIVDDKGCILIVCFGISMHSHLQDQDRVLATAFELAAHLQQLECTNYCPPSMGIFTGQAVVGQIGRKRHFGGVNSGHEYRRQDYAVVGNCVNMASRLMGKFPGHDIVCDITTKELSTDFIFQVVKENFMPKGSRASMSVFAPIAQKLHNNRVWHEYFVGREIEKQDILNHLTSFHQHVIRAPFLVIAGDYGTGKTVFLDWVKSNLRKRFTDIETIECAATENSTKVHYFALKPLMKTIFLQSKSGFSLPALVQAIDSIINNWTKEQVSDPLRKDEAATVELAPLNAARNPTPMFVDKAPLQHPRKPIIGAEPASALAARKSATSTESLPARKGTGTSEFADFLAARRPTSRTTEAQSRDGLKMESKRVDSATERDVEGADSALGTQRSAEKRGSSGAHRSKSDHKAVKPSATKPSTTRNNIEIFDRLVQQRQVEMSSDPRSRWKQVILPMQTQRAKATQRASTGATASSSVHAGRAGRSHDHSSPTNQRGPSRDTFSQQDSSRRKNRFSSIFRPSSSRKHPAPRRAFQSELHYEASVTESLSREHRRGDSSLAGLTDQSLTRADERAPLERKLNLFLARNAAIYSHVDRNALMMFLECSATEIALFLVNNELLSDSRSEGPRTSMPPGSGAGGDSRKGGEAVESDATSSANGALAAELLKLLVLLSLKSKKKQTVIIVDGLHFLDHASLSLLSSIHHSTRHVAVIGTSYVSHVEASLADPRQRTINFDVNSSSAIHYFQSRDVEVTCFVLKAMGLADIHGLLLHTFNWDHAPRELVNCVYETSRGNPLWALEMVKGMLVDKIIERDEANQTVIVRKSLHVLGDMSNGLYGAIMYRFDRLNEVEKAVMNFCVVAGIHFTSAMIAELVPQALREEAPPAFRQLVNAGFLAPDGTDVYESLAVSNTERTYSVSHTCYQQYIYQTLSHHDARLHHEKTARWLEAHNFAYSKWFALLAHHYEMAGDKLKAMRGYSSGARYHFRYGQSKKGCEYLTRAIALGEQLVASGDTNTSARYVAQMRVLLAQQLVMSGKVKLALKIVDRLRSDLHASNLSALVDDAVFSQSARSSGQRAWLGSKLSHLLRWDLRSTPPVAVVSSHHEISAMGAEEPHSRESEDTALMEEPRGWASCCGGKRAKPLHPWSVSRGIPPLEVRWGRPWWPRPVVSLYEWHVARQERNVGHESAQVETLLLVENVIVAKVLRCVIYYFQLDLGFLARELGGLARLLEAVGIAPASPLMRALGVLAQSMRGREESQARWRLASAARSTLRTLEKSRSTGLLVKGSVSQAIALVFLNLGEWDSCHESLRLSRWCFARVDPHVAWYGTGQFPCLHLAMCCYMLQGDLFGGQATFRELDKYVLMSKAVHMQNEVWCEAWQAIFYARYYGYVLGPTWTSRGAARGGGLEVPDSAPVRAVHVGSEVQPPPAAPRESAASESVHTVQGILGETGRAAKVRTSPSRAALFLDRSQNMLAADWLMLCAVRAWKSAELGSESPPHLCSAYLYTDQALQVVKGTSRIPVVHLVFALEATFMAVMRLRWLFDQGHLCEQVSRGSSVREAGESYDDASVKELLEAFREIGQAFPATACMYLRCKGLHEGSRKNWKLAVSAWTRAVRLANKFGMEGEMVMCKLLQYNYTSEPDEVVLVDLKTSAATLGCHETFVNGLQASCSWLEME